MQTIFLLLVGIVGAASESTLTARLDATVPSQPLDVESCVEHALGHSAKVAESRAKVKIFAARLAQIEASFYPKIEALAFVAPMYTVRGSGFEREREVRFKSIKDWGPYLNIEMRVAQPISSFGRAKAGREAAAARKEVEEGRVRETQHALAREVRRFYYLRLMPLSLLPALTKAEALLTQAQEHAEQVHAHGHGEISQVDLGRIANGLGELRKARIQAEHGEALALSALKHTMGLAESAALEQAERVLPPISASEPLELDVLVAEAQQQRPEWDELRAARRATEKLARAEKLAAMPTLAIAGAFAAAKTPTRSADENPWHHDAYNRLMGGIALALHFDTDIALTRAKARTALAQGEEVAALAHFAATGIPLEVRRAHDDMARLREQARETEQQVVATRRWMTFAGSAYNSGTGEARDLLEGLAAHLQARRGHAETLQQFYTAKAELTYAVGRLRDP